jgi:hypothetical protein
MQANAIYCRQMFFCRQINKLQAGPAQTLQIGNASFEFNIAFL